jgi:hypothetical protein
MKNLNDSIYNPKISGGLTLFDYIVGQIMSAGIQYETLLTLRGTVTDGLPTKIMPEQKAIEYLDKRHELFMSKDLKELEASE